MVIKGISIMDPIYEAYKNNAVGTPLYTIEMNDDYSRNTYYVIAGSKPDGSMYYVMYLNDIGKGVNHSLKNLYLKKSPPSKVSSEKRLEKELKNAFSSSKTYKMVNFYPYDKFA